MDPEFHAFVRYLKKNLPHPRGRPVTVRTRPMAWHYGTCNIDYYRCNITINSRQEHNFAIESLCHEWAHMLDVRSYKEDRREEHRQSWGKHYAKVYQHYWRFKRAYDAD